MSNRVVVDVDGVFFIQQIGEGNRIRDLQAAVNYLLHLIDREAAKGGTHG